MLLLVQNVWRHESPSEPSGNEFKTCMEVHRNLFIYVVQAVKDVFG